MQIQQDERLTMNENEAAENGLTFPVTVLCESL
jgi:hypothetical protein